MRTEDGYIIGRCLNGEKVAFGFLVDKYREAVYALAYSKIHNFHDAEDITQEVFVKAYKNLHTLRRWDNFMAWLYSITHNHCKNWIRKQSQYMEDELAEDQYSQKLIRQSMDAYHDELSSEQLRDALNSLPQIHSQILTLHYLGGMTVGDIASFLAKSPRTIARRLAEARERLKAEMLDILSVNFEEQKLPVGFTLRVLDLIERIKFHPILRTNAAPWGISVAAAITLVLLVFSSSQPSQYPVSQISTMLSSERRMGGMGESQLDISQAIQVFLIPSGLLDGPDRGPDTATAVDTSYVISHGSMDSGEMKFARHEANPVITSEERGVWDMLTNSPSVLFDGMEYKMWYTGVDGIYSSIGYATSPDGIMWTKHPDNPVFTASGSGWDSLYVSHPEVMRVNGGYKMWYAGCDDAPLWRTGYATSEDGITWARHPASPVLDLGADGEWDCREVRHPNVLFNGSQYKMWYTGKGAAEKPRIGYATSNDGIIWVKHPANPVLDIGNNGAWDYRGVRSACVLFDGVQYKMWYNGNQRNYRIGYATSADGLVWTKHYDVPVLDLGPGGSWDDDEVGSPMVLLDNGQYKMWYHGFDGTASRIGYATGIAGDIASRNVGTSGGQSWSRSGDEKIVKERMAPADDPAVKTVLLYQNYPNPFNPETWIPYELQTDADVTLRIYRADRTVRTLKLGHRPAGAYTSKSDAVYWDGRNETGEQVASGVYFYRIQAGGYTDTKKMTIVR